MKKRWEWLIRIINHNNFKIGAEVGVARGRTTKQILINCPDLNLICVDNWVSDEAGEEGGVMSGEWVIEEVQNEFIENTKKYQDRITFIESLSWLAVSKIKDESLDFVFIDADHHYESVCKDIRAWMPKIKCGGIICGHDIHFDGVRKAVNELLPGWVNTNIDHVWFRRIYETL